MKTSELIGPALDWAVAECEGYIDMEHSWLYGATVNDIAGQEYHPSEKWSIAGPIIERERIKVFPNVGGTWSAQIRHTKSHPLVSHPVLAGWTNSSGPTALIAAMRCLVASRLGDEVEIPNELQGVT